MDASKKIVSTEILLFDFELFVGVLFHFPFSGGICQKHTIDAASHYAYKLM